MNERWSRRFKLIVQLGWVGLAGLFFLIVGLALSGFMSTFALVAGVMLCMPVFIYTYVVTIWHWKERYKGDHSDLWGALMLLETSGWSKLVYLFRHIIPDMRRTGRYKPNAPPVQ
jgi:hypothetical protein